MKKVSIFILALLFFNISPNLWIADNNLENFKTDNINTIESAKLLEKYIEKLLSQLKSFKFKYNIQNDTLINNSINKLERMLVWLDKIKSNNLDNEKASSLITNIVDELKSINYELKPYLKEKLEQSRQEVSDYKNKYGQKLKVFSAQLRNIISTLISRINLNKNISNSDEKIKIHLRYLENYISKLENFERVEFYSTKDLKNYMVSNIRNITNEMFEIKKILTKKD